MYDSNVRRPIYATEQAEKEACAQQGTAAGLKQAYYGDTCGKEISIRERLQIQAMQAEGQADQTKRAIDILDRHPDFEELLWLIRSGLV